jgi:hypothetical protein
VHTIQVFLLPAKYFSILKAYSVKSTNSKLKDQLLNGEIFDTILETKIIIWNRRKHYNHKRAHISLRCNPPAPEAIFPIQIASARMVSAYICIGTTINLNGRSF